MIEFTLLYKKNGMKVTKTFNSFASASGAASALQGTVWLGAYISEHGYGSHSGNMYKYKNGTRQKINQGFINVVKDYMKRI